MDDKFLEQLSRSLQYGTLVISVLEQGLADYDDRTTRLSFNNVQRWLGMSVR